MKSVLNHPQMTTSTVTSLEYFIVGVFQQLLTDSSVKYRRYVTKRLSTKTLSSAAVKAAQTNNNVYSCYK